MVEDEFCLVGVLLLQFLVSGCDSEFIFLLSVSRKTCLS